MWIELQYPNDDDLDQYPIVDMTLDIQWNPSDMPSLTESAVVREDNPIDIDKLAPCLGWKPKEVIGKTLACTTNYAKTT